MEKEVKNIEELSKEGLLELLAQKDAEFKKHKEQSTALVKDLKAEVAKKKNLTGPVFVTHKGVEFEVICKRFTKPDKGGGIEYTAEQLAENPDVVAWLVSIDSGVLKRVV